jgi:hypothetical protein
MEREVGENEGTSGMRGWSVERIEGIVEREQGGRGGGAGGEGMLNYGERCTVQHCRAHGMGELKLTANFLQP